MIDRLNIRQESKNWLSIQPTKEFIQICDYYAEFAEHKGDNEVTGRYISIYHPSFIRIGYYEDDYVAAGNYIDIYNDGEFHVGEYYFKDGKKWNRGIRY